jgi:hypothetical protein
MAASLYGLKRPGGSGAFWPISNSAIGRQCGGPLVCSKITAHDGFRFPSPHSRFCRRRHHGAAPPAIRLNKRMADLGRVPAGEADDWIARWVRVNGGPL